MESENVEIVRRFCEAFGRRDSDELLEFFTEDGVYHNMPMAPMQGKAAIRTVLDMFLKMMSESVEFVMLKIAEGDGAVLTERLDRFLIGGKSVELPVAGVFELKDGKIVAWRDYFDMGAWTRQTSGG
ncbi:MAG TPA: limonene-1,2-epoxide hydrolase family protein [Dehalococcoidia bacterium]|nr:limonene-1,2-epoxide hydrolase family protein [Dehalococcoidia bacterium]